MDTMGMRLPFLHATLWGLLVLSSPNSGWAVENEAWCTSTFWETVDGKPVESSWEFADGEIRLLSPRGGKGSLVSPPLASNFELSFQWKIEAQTNTGLKYRVRKFGNKWLGVEYQIIDEPIPLPASSKGSTASIYELVAPSLSKPLLPAGSWNHAKIIAQGNRIEHYLGGQLVAQTHTNGPQWQAMIARSKFYGNEGFGLATEGDRIMLTDHGGKAVYKDFHFVALPMPQESETQTPKTPQLGNAMRNSWADQTSIVLWTRTTERADMVVDGPQFTPISNKQVSELDKAADANAIMAAQIPAGSQLEDMFGASPGAAGEVRLTYFPVTQRQESISTEWSLTAAESDFTHQWKVEDLKPGTEYAAVVEARAPGSEELTAVLRGGFETALPATSEEDLKFCLTTCHDFPRRDDGMLGHKIYPAMTAIEPDFVVHAGDIEYYDKADPWAMTVELMRFKWARIFSLPNNRRFYADKTTYFIKDDHDTLKNDCWAGQHYGAVSFEQGLQVFNEEQFPSHEPRYKTVRWGQDLQIWLLEGRDFRSPNNMPDGPNKTILGDQQKAWLFETLNASDAKFKLVFSPTPIVGPDRNNKKDNHANEIFEHEGDELRQRLSAIEGVIVFCGDRHWQYASVDAESGLWEFGCGPGSEKHQLGWKKGDVRPVHQFLRVAGGFLSGEVLHAGASPQLILRHHSVTGEMVSEFVFPTE